MGELVRMLGVMSEGEWVRMLGVVCEGGGMGENVLRGEGRGERVRMLGVVSEGEWVRMLGVVSEEGRRGNNQGTIIQLTPYTHAHIPLTVMTQIQNIRKSSIEIAEGGLGGTRM